MSDYLIRGIAADGYVRAFAATCRDTVEKARENHNLSPVAAAALGRLLTAGAMMGSMMKGDNDILTLQVHSGGPIGGLTVTADTHGRIKGYANNPGVMLPPSPEGKLDVGGAVGLGILSVIKDLGLKDPYIGQVPLQTGEIAEDITYYFASSEQIPSGVGLGVLMNRDNTVRQAGGFIVQVMPGVPDRVLTALEEALKKIPPVTKMLDKGETPEDMLGRLLGDMDFSITDRQGVEFYCNCSREKVEKVILSMGEKEIQSMIEEGEPTRVNCHFCNKDYIFTIEELEALVEKALN